MDILKTFEIFLAAPISIIQKREIKIVHVETNIFNQKLPVNIDFDEDIQVTVYNNKKVYKLLSTVLYKKKKENENNESKIHNERSFFTGLPGA